MALIRRELSVLNEFLPEGASGMVIEFLHQYKIHLKIKRERRSVLGDYRPSHSGKPHTISVNSNLNPYHFLITFVHELAHLVNYIEHGRRVAPHGAQWKAHFGILLKKFIEKDIFPDDIRTALDESLHNQAASTCSNPVLFKILHRYDQKIDVFLVEQFSVGEVFRTDKGEKFKVVEKRRTRFACRNLETEKMYLFPGIYEVFKE